MMSKSTLDYTFEYLDQYVAQWFDKEAKKPLFIFISGPQGSGKSFTGLRVFKYLQDKYSSEKRNVLYASIDDFYLTHEEQLKLEEEHAGDPLFKGRGLPGTHDIQLLAKCMNEVVSSFDDTKPDKPSFVNLPAYDKSQYNGEGDRFNLHNKQPLPGDIFIFEGWFLGFQSLNNEEISSKYDTIFREFPGMKLVNALLFQYGKILWNNKGIESLGIVLETDSVEENIRSWRVQQEHETISLYGEGMTDEEVNKFIDRYIPCYDVYYNTFIKGEDLGSLATLTIKIDGNRQPIAKKIRSFD